MDYTIYEKIKNRRIELGYSQEELAKLMGYKSRSTINKIESGQVDITRNKIAKFAKVLQVKASYLMGWTNDENNKQLPTNTINFHPRAGVKIPILGVVVAGTPISAIENILGYEEITPEMAATGDFFCLKVKGASMEPKLFEGDLLIIRQQTDVDSNEIAVVLVNGDEATVKQIKKATSGITLIGYNVAVYPPRFYSNQEIQDLPVTIIGKVVELRRPF